MMRVAQGNVRTQQLFDLLRKQKHMSVISRRWKGRNNYVVGANKLRITGSFLHLQKKKNNAY
jgi:hypothetical protein